MQQMLAGLDEVGRSAAWAQIEQKSSDFEGPSGLRRPL